MGIGDCDDHTQFKRIYDVGPDGFGIDNNEVLPGTKWVVVWYVNHGWEGDGLAIAKVGRGTYYEALLSHCSCYGPLDESPWGKIGDFRSLLVYLRYDDVVKRRKRRKEDYDYERYAAVEKEVKRLHRQEQRTRRRRNAKRSKQVSCRV